MNATFVTFWVKTWSGEKGELSFSSALSCTVHTAQPSAVLLEQSFALFLYEHTGKLGKAVGGNQ